MAIPNTEFAATLRQEKGDGMEIFLALGALGAAFTCMVWRFALVAFLPQPPSNADVMQWASFLATLWALYVVFRRKHRDIQREDQNESETANRASLVARIEVLEAANLKLREELEDSRRQHTLCRDEIARLNRTLGSKSWPITATQPPPDQPA